MGIRIGYDFISGREGWAAEGLEEGSSRTSLKRTTDGGASWVDITPVDIKPNQSRLRTLKR